MREHRENTTPSVHARAASLALALAVVLLAPRATAQLRAPDAGPAATVAPLADAGVRAADASAPSPDASSADAGELDPAASSAAATDEPATPAEDAAARAALGSEAQDAPDPIAEEGERTGTAEGEPVPDRATAASEIAALSDRACLRALLHAHVPFQRLHHTVAGIATPVRVTGPIAGVRYGASDRREIHELMDCRLAVALVRFSHLLRPLQITEVRHYSTYRPPDDRAVARQPIQARHGGGLAIDAAWFLRADGARFNVERDFHGRRGRPVCGPDARVPNDPAARLLRTIACDAARRGIFTVILTPNFNYPHRNHFHMEVTRGANWRSVR